VLRGWLDALLFRGPFRGTAAARYLAVHRQAFGDTDARVVAALKAERPDARVVLDVGAGDGRVSRALAAAFPQVIAVEPSVDLVRRGSLRATAEALPLRAGSVDLALFLSSLRHVENRSRALAELRRVVRGSALVVELDPTASQARIDAHVSALPSLISRLTFAPLILGTAPRPEALAALATRAGWRASWEPDPLQPFTWMWLR
jgi:SAM-dependent methyltransferase